MRRLHLPRLLACVSVGSLCLAATACGSSDKESKGSSGSNEKLKVATSFYPVQWLTEQIGGDEVSVSSVTPTNVEPHDFELSPADIAKLGKVDALVYVKGFQPSLDEAADAVEGPEVVDLSSSVDLVHHEGLGPHVHSHTDKDGNVSTHTHEADSDEPDPHFWLDPVRMEKAADRVTEALSKKDPDSADAYKANNETLKKKLGQLNDSYASGLKTCQHRTIVTTHTAFGYLADRYKLEQVALSGVDPEAEPSPAVLADVKKHIQESGTTTIFTETLVSPKVAEALAKETGVKTDVLDPMESAPEGSDYAGGMKKNLTALRTALGCS